MNKRSEVVLTPNAGRKCIMATKKAKAADETTKEKTVEETTETKTAEEQKGSAIEKEIADIKAMLEQLAAQNKELRKENEVLKTKRTYEQSSVKEDNNKQKAIDRMKELVTITLFKDNGKYKDDLVVQLAGVAYQIKRGVQVMIPRAVYDIVIRSQQQDQKTANMLDSLQAEYAEKNK